MYHISYSKKLFTNVRCGTNVITTSVTHSFRHYSSSSSNDGNLFDSIPSHSNSSNNNNNDRHTKRFNRDQRKQKIGNAEEDENEYHQRQTGYFTGTRYLKNKPKELLDDDNYIHKNKRKDQYSTNRSDRLKNEFVFDDDDQVDNNEKRSSIRDRLDQIKTNQKPNHHQMKRNEKQSSSSNQSNEFVFDDEKEDNNQFDDNEISKQSREMFNGLDPQSRQLAIKAERNIEKRKKPSASDTPITEEERKQLLERKKRKRLIAKLSSGINQYLCFRDFFNDEDKADILVWFLDRDINIPAPHGILETGNMVDAVVNILVKLQRLDEAITLFKSNQLASTSSLLGIFEGLTRTGRKEDLLEILNENGERFNDRLFSNHLETIYKYANRHGFMFMKDVTKILTEKYETKLKLVQQFYIKNCVDRYTRVSDAMLAIEELSKQEGAKLGFAYNYLLLTILEKDDLNLHFEIMENIVNQKAQLNAVSCQLLLEYFVLVNRNTYAHHENYQAIIDNILKIIKSTALQTQAYLLFYNQIAYPEIYDLIEPVLLTLDQNPYITDIVAKSYLHLNLYDKAMEWYTKRIIFFGVMPSFELVDQLQDYHREDIDQSLYNYWTNIKDTYQLAPFVEQQNIDFTKDLNLSTSKHLDEFFKAKPNGQKHIPTASIRSIIQQDVESQEKEMLQREKMLLSHIQERRPDHAMNFINYRFFHFKHHLSAKYLIQMSQCIAHNLHLSTFEIYAQLMKNCSQEQRILLFNPTTFSHFFTVFRVGEQLLDLLKDFPAFLFPEYQKAVDRMVAYLFSLKRTTQGVALLNKYDDLVKIDSKAIALYISALATHYNQTFFPNTNYKYNSTQPINESMVKLMTSDPVNHMLFTNVFKMINAIDKSDFDGALKIFNGLGNNSTEFASGFLPLIHRSLNKTTLPDIKSYNSIAQNNVKHYSHFVTNLLQILASDQDYEGVTTLLQRSVKNVPELSIQSSLVVLVMKSLMVKNDVSDVYKLFNQFNIQGTSESKQEIQDILKQNRALLSNQK
ncbi:hypothetical protein CYY_004927 [Polysphondylium violaceum]|uniref:Uncharacterized protein n=1 Tax=Polysphondylium violaceum TaxID=133409 RepID=A0A8J4PSK5_9MYCE|nr:hypothetical protein CYY_004927 [Polysphondylium violaceum]